MNETEKLLLDIATRMPDGKAFQRVIDQLAELQKSLNTCMVGVYAIAALLGLIAFKLVF